MALYAVGRADDEDGVVQNLQRPLHFRRKVNVARRVEQNEAAVRQIKHSLLGKDRDAALTLLRVRVKERIPVVDAAHRAEHPRAVEHRLGERGLSGVHVGQYSDRQCFHPVSPVYRFVEKAAAFRASSAPKAAARGSSPHNMSFRSADRPARAYPI